MFTFEVLIQLETSQKLRESFILVIHQPLITFSKTYMDMPETLLLVSHERIILIARRK